MESAAIKFVCCVCLEGKNTILMDIFEQEFYQDITLAKALFLVTGLVIGKQDNDVSHQICCKCLELLRNAMKLWTRVRSNHLYQMPGKRGSYILNRISLEAIANSSGAKTTDPQFNKRSKSWTCQICKMGFRNSVALHFHLRKDHTSDQDSSVSSSSNMYVCRNCNQIFSELEAVYTHDCIAQAAQPQVTQASDKPLNKVLLKRKQETNTGVNEKMPKFQRPECSYCHEFFDSDLELKTHACAKNPTNVVCLYCKKVFNSIFHKHECVKVQKDALELHQGKVQCKYCGKWITNEKIHLWVYHNLERDKSLDCRLLKRSSTGLNNTYKI